jgi:hypothetical protein
MIPIFLGLPRNLRLFVFFLWILRPQIYCSIVRYDRNRGMSLQPRVWFFQKGVNIYSFNFVLDTIYTPPSERLRTYGVCYDTGYHKLCYRIVVHEKCHERS